MTEQLATMPEDWERAVVIVAHPDDMEYGGSAAIAKWTGQGKKIAYVLATRGEAGIDSLEPAKAAAVREQEQRDSAAIVGVSAVEFLDHRDGVIEYGVRLRQDLAQAIRRHRPELVITMNHHSSWGGQTLNSPDHIAVGQAALDAAADAGNQWIFPGYGEKWDGVRWIAVTASPNATHAVDVDGYQEIAARSLAAHATYIRVLSDRDPDEYAAEWIDQVLGMSSSAFGDRPCVSFELFPR